MAYKKEKPIIAGTEPHKKAKKAKMLKGTTVFGKTIPEIKKGAKKVFDATPGGILYNKAKKATKKALESKTMGKLMGDEVKRGGKSRTFKGIGQEARLKKYLKSVKTKKE